MGDYDSCYEYDNHIRVIRGRVEKVLGELSINEGESIASDIYKWNRYELPTQEEVEDYINTKHGK